MTTRTRSGIERSHPFEDDLFTGIRLTFNDAKDTDFLLGVIVDRKSAASVFSSKPTGGWVSRLLLK